MTASDKIALLKYVFKNINSEEDVYYISRTILLYDEKEEMRKSLQAKTSMFKTQRGKKFYTRL